MGTEVGIFGMIVLIIVVAVFLLRIILIGAGLFIGSVIGFPFAISELTKNWKKMDKSEKISYICMIVIGICIVIDILSHFCL